MGKRFTDANQIIELIDRYKKEREELWKDAWDDDQLADKLRDTKWAWKIEGIRADAEKKRKQCGWRDTRIINLADSLSTINTPELPGCETDGSIPTS